MLVRCVRDEVERNCHHHCQSSLAVSRELGGSSEVGELRETGGVNGLLEPGGLRVGERPDWVHDSTCLKAMARQVQKENGLKISRPVEGSGGYEHSNWAFE